MEEDYRQTETESSLEPSGRREPRRTRHRRRFRFSRKHALLVAAAGVAGYFLRTDSIAREAAPVEVAERPPPPPPSSPATHSSRERLWIAPDELKSLSMSGSAWEAMLAVAEGDLSQKMSLQIEGRPVKGEFRRIGTADRKSVV